MTGNQNVVRAARPSDVPSICRFVYALAEYEKLLDSVSFSPEQYSKYLFDDRAAPFPEVLLVESGGASGPIGFALFIQIVSSTIHLEDLFVNPGCRGSGAGIALLSRLARVVIERGASRMEWTCLDWNEPSLKFYHSIGASPIRDRTIYRISGGHLHVDGSNLSRLPDGYSVSAVGTPAESGERRVDIVNNKDRTIMASCKYTLNFTTFLATPVILATEFSQARNIPPSVDSPRIFEVLVAELISLANSQGYMRVDIRVNPDEDAILSSILIASFRATALTEWISFALESEALHALANRT